MSPRGLEPLIPPGERTYDVLCLGLNSTDHLCHVGGFPQRGSKLRMSRFVTSGGGQSATAACALASLGRVVAYAGICGDDEPGLQVGPRLREFGVDPRWLHIKPGVASQQAFILVEADGGERTIIWHRDEDCHLLPEHIDPSLIADARVLHLDGHFLEASLAGARLAKDHGLLVSLDGERVYPGTDELVSLCDVVVGSRAFPRRLTGIEDSRGALEALADMGPAWVGRTRGVHGAELLVSGQYFEHAGFTVDAIDTTGAGDVFHAGLVHAVLDGLDPPAALELACAAAAISVTGLGGRSALADARELAGFLAAHAP